MRRDYSTYGGKPCVERFVSRRLVLLYSNINIFPEFQCVSISDKNTAAVSVMARCMGNGGFLLRKRVHSFQTKKQELKN